MGRCMVPPWLERTQQHGTCQPWAQLSDGRALSPLRRGGDSRIDAGELQTKRGRKKLYQSVRASRTQTSIHGSSEFTSLVRGKSDVMRTNAPQFSTEVTSLGWPSLLDFPSRNR